MRPTRSIDQHGFYVWQFAFPARVRTRVMAVFRAHSGIRAHDSALVAALEQAVEWGAMSRWQRTPRHGPATPSAEADTLREFADLLSRARRRYDRLSPESLGMLRVLARLPAGGRMDQAITEIEALARAAERQAHRVARPRGGAPADHAAAALAGHFSKAWREITGNPATQTPTGPFCRALQFGLTALDSDMTPRNALRRARMART